MEHFHELLKNRRSIRKYTGQPIDSDHVKLILEAALMSPASKRSNEWEFIVVEDKAMLEKLSHCKGTGAKPVAGATLAVVVAADPVVSDAWVEDASIASILMQMQAADLGLGSCWIQIRNRETEHGQSSEDYVKDALDIPFQMQILSIVTFGHKDEERKPYDLDKLSWEKVHVDKW